MWVYEAAPAVAGAAFVFQAHEFSEVAIFYVAEGQRVIVVITAFGPFFV